MKPITGPNACFQFIEERELPPSRKNKTFKEATEGDNVSATTSADSGVDRSDEMARNRHVKGYVRCLGEPGPEHLPGVESARDTSNDRYTDNEVQIVVGEKEMQKEVEEGRMKSSKSREEMKRLAKIGLGHDYQQTHEPGPEYFSNATDGENWTNKTEDGVLEKKECISDGLALSAIASHAASACDNAAAVDNIAKEGGGIGGGPSMMVTTNATADAMKSSVGGVAAVAAAAATAATTATAIPATGISMDSGSGGIVGAILIKGVQIINDDSIYMADVLIQDGIIQ